MTVYPTSLRVLWPGLLATVLVMWGVAARAEHPQPVKIAVARLAQELGVAGAAIRVDAVERVDWPDSSLGLAQPGQAYLTVITPGYRVRLSVGGERYVYHTDRVDPVTGESVLGEDLAAEREPAPDAASDLESPPGSVWPFGERSRFLRERWRWGRGQTRRAR